MFCKPPALACFSPWTLAPLPVQQISIFCDSKKQGCNIKDPHFRVDKGHKELLVCEDPLDLRELKEVEAPLDQKVLLVNLAFRD